MKPLTYEEYYESNSEDARLEHLVRDIYRMARRRGFKDLAQVLYDNKGPRCRYGITIESDVNHDTGDEVMLIELRLTNARKR